MSGTICIYHSPCADGFTAAWAVRDALGDNVEFIPGVYGERPPDVANADVIMVDFSYKHDVLHEIARSARTVLILDHHKTAAADLAQLPPPLDGAYNPNAMADWQRECNSPNALHALFDMDRSGAQMAWDYFVGGYRPPLVDYVGDRDLWRFEMPRSREVNAWIFAHQYSFEAWDDLAAELQADADIGRAADKGAAILQKHDKDIGELLKATKTMMVIGGYAVPVANLPYTYASDAAGAMAEGLPFAACYFDRADKRVFSLRSRGPDAVDVSEIAKAYGGGGHRNASGFEVPLDWRGEPMFTVPMRDEP